MISSSPGVARRDVAEFPRRPTGYGRVGSYIAAELARANRTFLVVEENDELLAPLAAENVPHIAGNGVRPDILASANVAKAKDLFVAIPEAFEAGQIIEQARELNPDLVIIARVHFDAEIDHLKGLGATGVVMGEREIARGMLDLAADPVPTP